MFPGSTSTVKFPGGSRCWVSNWAFGLALEGAEGWIGWGTGGGDVSDEDCVLKISASWALGARGMRNARLGESRHPLQFRLGPGPQGLCTLVNRLVGWLDALEPRSSEVPHTARAKDGNVSSHHQRTSLSSSSYILFCFVVVTLFVEFRTCTLYFLVVQHRCVWFWPLHLPWNTAPNLS